MKWKPIVDLPEELSRFHDRELEALFRAWTNQRQILPQEHALAQFNLELKREWAIETGIVEGVYTLDRGTTETLIERGIEASYIRHDATNRDPELVARTIQAHAEVLEGLFAFIKDERPLGTSYIKELHAALLRHQDKVTVTDQFGNLFETDLLKGAYKTQANNPSREDGSVHEYCPPEHVASEMDRLIELHAQHLRDQLRPEVAAAWLHHAFTQIHPFQDGNGRVARTLATLVFLKAAYFPLVIRRGEEYGRYIEALELADAGDLEPVVRLFSAVQKRLLTQAIGLAIDARPVTNVAEAIQATRDLLTGLGQVAPDEWGRAKSHANLLAEVTLMKLRAMAAQLQRQISGIGLSFAFSADVLSEPPDRAYFTLSQKLFYVPNFREYHQSRLLRFESDSGRSVIVVSFHGIGESFRGLLACSAYFQAGVNDPVTLSEEIYRVSYEEDPSGVTARFSPWLEACLVKGIELWRRTLV